MDEEGKYGKKYLLISILAFVFSGVALFTANLDTVIIQIPLALFAFFAGILFLIIHSSKTPEQIDGSKNVFKRRLKHYQVIIIGSLFIIAHFIIKETLKLDDEISLKDKYISEFSWFFSLMGWVLVGMGIVRIKSIKTNFLIFFRSKFSLIIGIILLIIPTILSTVIFISSLNLLIYSLAVALIVVWLMERKNK